jgi:Domain of unknown function (DUF1330)
MSGGAAVKAGGGVEGERPVCTIGPPPEHREGGKETKTRGRPGIRPAPPLKGLGLDGPGDAVPYFLKTWAKPAGRRHLLKRAQHWPHWNEINRSPLGTKGGPEPKRIVILEFADTAAVKRWYNSPEYQKILPMRLDNSTGRAFIVEGAS